jgi:hypothetical protein
MIPVCTTVHEVLTIMLRLMNMQSSKIKCNEMIVRNVRATFGLDVDTTTYLWNLVVASFTDLPDNFKLIHLLWFLSYCKSYLQYESYTTKYNCNKSTFRSWVMYVGKKLNELEVVSFIKFFLLLNSFTYINVR